MLTIVGVLLASAWAAGTASANDVATVAGVCSACHFAEAAAAVETGGHAPVLECRSCHADRRPGGFGRGHRAVRRCTSHHEVGGHPPKKRRGRRAQRNCLRCHDPHGTPNLAHVRTRIRTRGRLRPIDFVNTSGAAVGGFTNPDEPGTGLCETCHRKTEFYRRDGMGADHFTASCTDCHMHEVGFLPVTTEDNCVICHQEQGARYEKPSGHSAELLCGDCHEDAGTGAQFGEGHRTIPDCAGCHDNVTHAPPGTTPFDCVDCHEPHGTDNISLVRETITVPQGGDAPITFDSIAGQADGSFASASAPGTGICEVCHTTTLYYRADGGGADHFTFSCLPCHRHSEGFLPR